MAATITNSRNELTIRGTSPHIAQLMERLKQVQTNGWMRDAAAESRLHAMRIAGKALCFACESAGSRPAAALWLQPRGNDELYVANVVPLGKQRLSDDEHNIVLGDFESAVVSPATSGLEVETELVYHRATPESYLSGDAMRRLKAFSNVANKNFLLPEDCGRWQEFIIQSHVDHAEFDPMLLDQWLAEQGWPEEQRDELTREYQATRSMLRAYDEERLEKCHR